MNYRIGLMAAGLCGMISTFARAESVPPALEAMRCPQPPLVDGILTDACWQTQAMITNLHVFQAPGKTRPVRAWVAKDDAWLYFAADIPHPNPQHVKRTVVKHNGPVTADDSLEIFLDPGTDGVFYLQYMLNSLNVGAEKYVTRKSDHANPGLMPWRSGAIATPDGWSAEVAVPLAFLAAYGDLDKCRFNFNVNLILPKIDPSQVRIGETKEFLSFAPVKAGFHEPESFGWLKGLETSSVRVPFFPNISGLTVERYLVADGNYAYGLAMKMSSAFAQSGTARLEVEDRPITGPAEVIAREIKVAGRDPQDVQIMVPVSAMVERRAVVRLKDPATGEIYQAVPLEADDMAVLRLMTCYLDRSYYTTEAEARAVCVFSLPAEELAQLKVAVRSEDATTLAEVAPAQTLMQAPIPLSGLALGAAELQVDLCRANGEKLTGQAVTLIKRSPKPGCEWKIDRVNRILLRNGQPYLGFGIVTHRFTEDIARDIAAAGLDHVCILDLMCKPETTLENRRLAEKYGLYLMDYLDGYMTTNAPISFKLGFERGPLAAAAAKKTPAERQRLFDEFRPAKRQLVQEVIASLKDSPNVMGYFSIDEPGCHPEVPDMPQRGRDLYRMANEADGYHPLYLNFSSYIPAGDEWTDWTDVLGTDPYWIAAGNIHRGTPNFLSQITAATDQRARPGRQPCWIIPMSAYWSGTTKRLITPQEQFCQTYLALIHGAKLLTYFAYGTLIHQENYDTLRDLAGQMKKLGPIMLTPDVPWQVKYTPVEWAPDKALYPSVQVTLRSRPEGGYALVCANSKWYPVDATFQLRGLTIAAAAVGELFAPERQCPVQDGTFSDTFEPFGTRVYLIAGERLTDGAAPNAAGRDDPAISGLPSAVVINVKAADHPEQAVAEPPETPRSGRVGKKNLAANPSFEEMSLPELPDYYYSVLGYHGLPPIRSGSPHARYAAVTNHPFHGEYCVRLAGRSSGNPAQVRFCLAPMVEQSTQFTLSIHMRADRDGVKAGLGSISLPDWKTKTVSVSTNWQRVAVTGAIPPGLSPYHQFVFFAGTDDSTVWFDAVQLEKGDTPTDFEP